MSGGQTVIGDDVGSCNIGLAVVVFSKLSCEVAEERHKCLLHVDTRCCALPFTVWLRVLSLAKQDCIDILFIGTTLISFVYGDNTHIICLKEQHSHHLFKGTTFTSSV